MELEAYAEGEEASLVAEETTAGAGPRLPDHIPNRGLGFDNNLDLFSGFSAGSSVSVESSPALTHNANAVRLQAFITAICVLVDFG